MPTIIPIDPVTRLEGHLKVEITVDTVDGIQQVVDAKTTGTMFRGFESILVGRSPDDAPHITQRICGVCPVSHGLAAVSALDAASGLTVTNNARILRNLVLGSNFLSSHVLHFYHLALADFTEGPAMEPVRPGLQTDKRLPDSIKYTLMQHFALALGVRRKAHEMGSIFGGRLPHPPSFIWGGITAVPNATRIALFRKYLVSITGFVQNMYIKDVEKLAQYYPDYFHVGAGPGNFIAYGVFDQNSTGSSKLLARGRIVKGQAGAQPLDVNAITEHVSASWYADGTNNLRPSAGVTTPQYPKGNAYSWLKAPRYAGTAYEAGALARMVVNGSYGGGASVMDRHRARAYEAEKIALAMSGWLNQLTVGQAVYTKPAALTTSTSYGLTEAARGALGHWVSISGGKIARYQIITPTCWNASPADATAQKGPLEQALIGTQVQKMNEPVEVLRVIHSFDPCLSCAVHVMRPAEDARIFALGVA